ncbi:hypothetical protein ScPMuIL_011861 [Solemya velum]
MSAIVDNKDLRPHKPLANLFWNDFWGTPMHMEKSHKSYRPLCVLTFRLNYSVTELEPMSYHLVNMLLHMVVCVLFMKVCSMFLKSVPSFLAALLFAVHPIHTEAVTGVVGRAEALSSIFYLAALMTYSRSTNAKSQTAWTPLIITVALVAVAMLCKEQGITVIGVCCVYEVFVARKATFTELMNIITSFLRGKPVTPNWLRGSLVRTGFLVGSTLFLLFARIKVMGAQLPVFTNFDNPASGSPTPDKQLTYNYLLAINAWLLLFPSELCCDWTMGTVPVIKSILDYRNVFTVLFYVIMFKLATFALKCQNVTNRALIMCLALIVLPFVPASNLFFPVGFVVAERILYAPSMGFCMMVALGFDILLHHKEKLKSILWLLMGFLVLIHATKTINRNADWKSEYNIFRAALKVNQRNAKLFNNVGHALEKKYRYSDALEYFIKASEVQPDDIGAHMNVGRTYNTLNDTLKAESAYRTAMKLFPPIIPGKSYTARVAPQHLNLFLNLASLISKDDSRLLEADELLKNAVSMRPDYIKGYINRGDIMVRLGRFYVLVMFGPYNLKNIREKNFQRIVDLEPNNIQAIHNLCVVYVEKQDLITAEKCLSHVHDMAPEEEYITRHLNIVRTRLNEIIKARREEEMKRKAESNTEQTEPIISEQQKETHARNQQEQTEQQHQTSQKQQGKEQQTSNTREQQQMESKQQQQKEANKLKEQQIDRKQPKTEEPNRLQNEQQKIDDHLKQGEKQKIPDQQDARVREKIVAEKPNIQQQNEGMQNKKIEEGEVRKTAEKQQVTKQKNTEEPEQLKRQEQEVQRGKQQATEQKPKMQQKRTGKQEPSQIEKPQGGKHQSKQTEKKQNPEQPNSGEQQKKKEKQEQSRKGKQAENPHIPNTQNDKKQQKNTEKPESSSKNGQHQLNQAENQHT